MSDPSLTMTAKQTLLIFERALNESPSPEGWRKFWREHGLDPDALVKVITKAEMASYDGSARSVAAGMQNLALGFLLGRMSCDPVWGME